MDDLQYILFSLLTKPGFEMKTALVDDLLGNVQEEF